jgi:hypothetical protein
MIKQQIQVEAKQDCFTTNGLLFLLFLLNSNLITLLKSKNIYFGYYGSLLLLT